MWTSNGTWEHTRNAESQALPRPEAESAWQWDPQALSVHITVWEMPHQKAANLLNLVKLKNVCLTERLHGCHKNLRAGRNRRVFLWSVLKSEDRHKQAADTGLYLPGHVSQWVTCWLHRKLTQGRQVHFQTSSPWDCKACALKPQIYDRLWLGGAHSVA